MSDITYCHMYGCQEVLIFIFLGYHFVVPWCSHPRDHNTGFINNVALLMRLCVLWQCLVALQVDTATKTSK